MGTSPKMVKKSPGSNYLPLKKEFKEHMVGWWVFQSRVFLPVTLCDNIQMKLQGSKILLVTLPSDQRIGAAARVQVPLWVGIRNSWLLTLNFPDNYTILGKTSNATQNSSVFYSFTQILMKHYLKHQCDMGNKRYRTEFWFYHYFGSYGNRKKKNWKILLQNYWPDSYETSSETSM